MQTPAHLARTDDSDRVSTDSPSIPRVIVCTPASKQVEAGDAKPGDVITDDLTPVTEPVSILGISHYWAMYPEYQPGGNNQPLWTATHGSKDADRPECKWHGDEKPAAAEVIKLALFSPQIGMRVLICQRSAVKPAKDMLRETDDLGVMLYGPLWRLGSVKKGRTYIPSFTHVGFADEKLAAQLFNPETAAEVAKLLAH